jgi:hypothetical protein
MLYEAPPAGTIFLKRMEIVSPTSARRMGPRMPVCCQIGSTVAIKGQCNLVATLTQCGESVVGILLIDHFLVDSSNSSRRCLSPSSTASRSCIDGSVVPHDLGGCNVVYFGTSNPVDTTNVTPVDDRSVWQYSVWHISCTECKGKIHGNALCNFINQSDTTSLQGRLECRDRKRQMRALGAQTRM